MKIRSVLLPCLVIVLAAATEFANFAFADDFHNCDFSARARAAVAAHKPADAAVWGWECSAKNPGTYGLEDKPSPLYTFGLFGREQTGTIANTGNITYDVWIEQFLRFEQVKADLKPGEVYHFAAFDNQWWSYALYSVVIYHGALPDPNARAWIQVDAPSPNHSQCADECTTNHNGCNQGCSEIPNAGPLCKASCDTMYSICLSHCPP